ncbi:hypothetical protein EDB89DRAFT_1909192 [Lactarius sanguifluus]|nr:hypothetical protein EDB89DRAFT_1909192 [Lactarius sanguifluus]
MTNVSVGPAYALNVIIITKVYYQLHLGFWFSLVLLLATQLTGFSLTSLCRRFLVWPTETRTHSASTHPSHTIANYEQDRHCRHRVIFLFDLPWRVAVAAVMVEKELTCVSNSPWTGLWAGPSHVHLQQYHHQQQQDGNCDDNNNALDNNRATPVDHDDRQWATSTNSNSDSKTDHTSTTADNNNNNK